MSKRVAAAAIAVSLLAQNGLAAEPPELERLNGRLGGVTEMRRWTSPRPDGGETDYQFLVRTGRGLPEAVQVLDQEGRPQSPADVEGADCTLAKVRLVTDRRGGAVVWAVRVFTRINASKAEPAPMDVYTFRPQAGDTPGDSAVVLRASAPPRRTPPLCRSSDIVKAMAPAAGQR